MLDKATRQLLDQFAEQSAQTDLHDKHVSIDEARAGARALFLGLAGDITTRCSLRHTVISGAAGEIPIRLYRPTGNSDAPLPAVVYFHGGGWCLADLDCYDLLMRELCDLSGCVFISVGYRLAPEHKFPAGLTDCCDVTSWAFAQAEELNIDAANIALMGDSAGGNLALVSASVLNDRGLTPAHLYLIYPVVDSASPHSRYPSRQTYGDGDYFLTRDAISDTCRWYLQQPEDASNPLVSPLLANEFAHLPPTSLTLAGCDPLYDEGIALAQTLKQHGVLSQLTTYEQTIHAFLSFGILPVARAARQVLAAQLTGDLQCKEHSNES